MSRATEGIEFLDPAAADQEDAPAQVEPEAAAPHGEPCSACGCPVEPLDKFCPACGTPSVVEATEVVTAEPQQQKHFRCENCGSEVATDPDQRSYVCPFCDSTYVIELTPQESGRETPEFVIGFAVTSEQATEKFSAWIRQKGWFQPGDLAAKAATDKLKGVYLPFWSFSMLAQSQWSASIGEYWYRTETYTTRDANGKLVTKTRRVRETEWWPLAGDHHRYYSGFLVSGSRGLPQRDAERIKPFNLPALKRFAPYFLAGWFCEEYSIERGDALQLCQQEFHRREQTNVGHFLPGDTHRSLDVSTSFSSVNSDLCLLPLYVLSYRYDEKIYRFLVNGQTGKCAGDKPVSRKRMWAAAGIVVAILAVVFIIGWLISRMT